MKNRGVIIGLVVTAVLILGGIFFLSRSKKPGDSKITPSPAPEMEAEQLPADQQPKISLQFSSDAHYVTVSVSNIHADQLEYNLIYDATVKSTKIQTGVNASTKLSGATTFSQRQLLGSESSGHFTYHQDIQNAVMELALRDSFNRSVFTGTYPFAVKAGSTVKPVLQ